MAQSDITIGGFWFGQFRALVTIMCSGPIGHTYNWRILAFGQLGLSYQAGRACSGPIGHNIIDGFFLINNKWDRIRPLLSGTVSIGGRKQFTISNITDHYIGCLYNLGVIIRWGWEVGCVGWVCCNHKQSTTAGGEFGCMFLNLGSSSEGWVGQRRSPPTYTQYHGGQRN